MFYLRQQKVNYFKKLFGFLENVILTFIQLGMLKSIARNITREQTFH